MNLFVGPLGSGKTSRLLEEYHQLVLQGAQTREIVVLVMGAAAVSEWRRRIDLPASAGFQIFTYFGFVQREVSRHWALIDKLLPDGPKALEPAYMTAETAHYLMSLLVDKYRNQGFFTEVRANAQQIAIQLIDNLNQAAVNGLSLTEAERRLTLTAGQDQAKQKTFAESFRVIDEFRQNCQVSRTLDYSLTVELFNKYLFQADNYWQEITGQWRYLVVDNLEESVPAAQDLILGLQARVRQSFLAYDPEGGHGVFFGADPESAGRRFLPICQVQQLGPSRFSTPEISAFADFLSNRTRTGGIPEGPKIIKGRIETQLRGEMLTQVGQQVVKLVNSGVLPHEVALVAPQVDKVMELSLSQYLSKHQVQLVNLTRGKRLLDQPFAQALISLALLVYPQWRLELNFSGLVQTFSLLLKLDPVRSALLAEAVFRNKLDLPDPEPDALRLRLGFDNCERYELLKGWLEQMRLEQPAMESLFQRVFGELLAPLLPGEQDLLACRQVIDSITKFNGVMRSYPAPKALNLDQAFLDMVLRGTLAAETLFRPPENLGKVILVTPYNFLLSPYVPAARFQFWLDVAGEQWLRGSAKELTNPFAMSRRWQGEWNDQIDQSSRLERMTGFVRSLLNKCGEGLYLASSYLNSQGYEQDGLLAQWLETPGVNSND